jgi:hypothetical protein
MRARTTAVGSLEALGEVGSSFRGSRSTSQRGAGFGERHLWLTQGPR